VPVVQNAKAQVPAKAPVWLLNGRGSLNQTLELRLDAGQLNARAQVVGRDGSQCDLSVNDPTVSRRHASICWTAGEFQLTDLGSTNGTWLDDQPVKQKMVTLRVGQTLTLGKVIFNVQGPMP
jgi:pSer/pThr/pTyr-binding forkhead associated (FHA) protein